MQFNTFDRRRLRLVMSTRRGNKMASHDIISRAALIGLNEPIVERLTFVVMTTLVAVTVILKSTFFKSLNKQFHSNFQNICLNLLSNHC